MFFTDSLSAGFEQFYLSSRRLKESHSLPPVVIYSEHALQIFWRSPSIQCDKSNQLSASRFAADLRFRHNIKQDKLLHHELTRCRHQPLLAPCVCEHAAYARWQHCSVTFAHSQVDTSKRRTLQVCDSIRSCDSSSILASPAPLLPITNPIKCWLNYEPAFYLLILIIDLEINHSTLFGE